MIPVNFTSETAIKTLTHAKLANAKYLVLYINHQSSFTDVNHYPNEKTILRSRSEIRIRIGCTINENKNPIFLFPKQRYKMFKFYRDPTSLEEKYQDNFRLQRRIPLSVVIKSFNHRTERFSRCIKYLFLISRKFALDDLNI